MKNGHGHGGNFMQRWLSRSSNASNSVSDGGSDMESNSSRTFSPPPLTDSSSTSASSAGIRTPRDSPVHLPSSRKHATARLAATKTPRTPPTKYAELPMVKTHRKLAVSLPANAHRPTALVSAQPPVKLHRLLSYHPNGPPLTYDITLHPSYISQTPSQIVSRRFFIQASAPQPVPVPEQDLSQYATTPPVTHMHIVSDVIPWSIHVHGQQGVSNDPKSFVRVADVLDAIYQTLRLGVTEREWDRTPRPYRDRVKRAYLARCARAKPYTLNGYEEKQGVRRVDWFLEETMFSGLTIITADKGGERRRGNGGGASETRWAMMVERR